MPRPGDGALAIGNANSATGQGAVALGNASIAAGVGSLALGASAVSGSNGVALGNAASNATYSNAVALGAGSVNTANNQVAVGGRTISGVAAGAAATDAVNVGQLNGAVAGVQKNIGLLSSEMDEMYDLRRQDRRDMKQGIASAVAIASAPMPSAPGGITYAVNGAMFRGEYAVGGSLSYRLNTASPMAVSAGFSYAGNRNNAARIGVSGEF